MNPVLAFNECAYRSEGSGAQRRYPNEEFCRFMGRRYFSIPREERSSVHFLEIGCGPGANMAMVLAEGFRATGIDLSPSAISTAHDRLKAYGHMVRLETMDMTQMHFFPAQFDCVVDVFATYSLDTHSFQRALVESARVLKRGGRFFTYTPGKGSDAFKNPGSAGKMDYSTLVGIVRETSPYFPTPHPFRFVSHAELKRELELFGFEIEYAETVTRTYRNGAETFEFLVVEARRG